MNSDFLVVGAGVAGASVGAFLSDYGKALILEGEERPGYHITGRSAAFFTTNYGNSTIRGLTEASRSLWAPLGLANLVQWVFVQLHLRQHGIHYRKLSVSFCS